MFAAPLPSGSGARALGVAGAFTALADDATAASWNPGGLTQLETPEFSYVFRFSHETDRHTSGRDGYEIGKDEYDNLRLNYMSVVYPFRFLERNMVVSLNYQETYDFIQEFHADSLHIPRHLIRIPGVRVLKPMRSVRLFTYDPDGHVNGYVEVTAHTVTFAESTLHQLLHQELIASLDFEQEGIIDAVSPSFALDITPRLSFGATFNVYGNSFVADEPIRSHTHALYEGYAKVSNIQNTRQTTWGSADHEGYQITGTGDVHPFSEQDQPYGPFTNISTVVTEYSRLVRGTYEETVEYEDLSGYNATFGILWGGSSESHYRCIAGFTLDG